MSSRVWNLCQSLLPREAKRADLFIVRAGIILAIVTVMAVWRSSGITSRAGSVWASHVVGRYGLEMLLIVQALTGLTVATRLAGDGVGDRKSGFLEMLALSGCTPREWLATRLLTILPAIATTWTIPIPFFFLVISFGGLEWERILLAEVLLLCQLTMLVAVGLVLAHGAAARSALRSLPSLVVALELIQSAPAMLATFCASQGWGVPAWLLDGSSFVAQSTTRRCVLATIKGTTTGPQLLAGCLIPLSIAAIAIVLWLLRLYAEPTEESPSFAHTCGRWLRWLLVRPREESIDVSPLPAPTLAQDAALPVSVPVVSEAPAAATQVIAPAIETRVDASKPVSRRSRRSWDDALAWQAYVVFHSGEKGTMGRGLMYAAAGLFLSPVILMSGPPWGEFAMAGLLVLCGGALFRGMSRAGECLQQEIRESTLATLMLTPHEPEELHDGWSRGTLLLLRPELGLLLVAIVVTMLRDPETLAPCILSGGLWLLSLGPFLTLSPLLPYSFKGIATGLLIFAAAVAVIVAAVFAAVLVHPWAAPLVLAPLAYGWSRICRSLVASWLMTKLRATA